MYTTPLSTLLNRMDRYQTIYTVEEQFKVRDLDEAIRGLMKTTQLPWTLKKSTIRVFDNVLEYPVANDHDELAYLDTNNQFSSQRKANFQYTSLQQFYEDTTYRNTMAEIINNGTKYLGIRYKDFNFGSQTVDTTTSANNYTCGGDASNPELNTVFFKSDEQNTSSSSISFDVVSNTGTANIACSFPTFGDTNYQRKYFFIWVYFAGVPTSVELQFGTDSSNYYKKSVTAQFSGMPFITGDWNLLAMDMDNVTTVGSPSSASFSYFNLLFSGLSTGQYFVEKSYLREWDLMDYWYYSINNCATSGSSIPNQAFFMNSSEQYSLDTSLVGDKEWADVVMYDAILSGAVDKKENGPLLLHMKEKRDNAWEKLMEQYPSMKPLIITNRWVFNNDYNNLDTPINY